MNQRDIVWIRFPYSNLQEGKARPALIVSRDAYNVEHEDVVICAVTSNLEPAPYKVLLSSEDLVDGDLPLESMVRADKLIQVEKALIDTALGRVDEPTYGQVAEAIEKLVRPAK